MADEKRIKSLPRRFFARLHRKCMPSFVFPVPCLITSVRAVFFPARADHHQHFETRDCAFFYPQRLFFTFTLATLFVAGIMLQLFYAASYLLSLLLGVLELAFPGHPALPTIVAAVTAALTLSVVVRRAVNCSVMECVSHWVVPAAVVCGVPGSVGAGVSRLPVNRTSTDLSCLSVSVCVCD
jgi:hypothetical protein